MVENKVSTTENEPTPFLLCAHCNRRIEKDHACIYTPEGAFHVRCNGEKERRIGAARAQQGISRQDIRRGLRDLKKAILRKQVCQYFPVDNPGAPYCEAGEVLIQAFHCTKTFAEKCKWYHIQQKEDGNE